MGTKFLEAFLGFQLYIVPLALVASIADKSFKSLVFIWAGLTIISLFPSFFIAAGEN